MSLFRKKKHEFDSFLYGLVLSKSRTLIRYVNEHDGGSDYARKQIIETKYNVSKMDQILRGFLIRALHKPENFTIEVNRYLTPSRDLSSEMCIEDIYSPYGEISYRIGDGLIYLDSPKYTLTTERNDINIFKSVFEALENLQKNHAAIDFNVEKRRITEHYLDVYGSEYP